MAKADLTAARLRELFDYDPETGAFTRQKPARYAGRQTGYVSADGYRVVSVDGFQYLAHRLVWLYMHGSWPMQMLDHINGIRSDNRISNLRDVSNVENSENRTRPHRNKKSSGPLGVCCVAGRWKAQIMSLGKVKHLGYFDTPDEASQAYLEAKRKHHSCCTI
jgi:hypothetical protein